MRITETVSHPADPQRTFEMLTDHYYQVERARRSGATDQTVTVDHASCRAAAARLRALSPVLAQAAPERAWAGAAGQVMGDLAGLLDRLADLSRTRPLTAADKGVVLRRLHGLARRLR